MRPLCYAILLAILVAGCAATKDVGVPTPPPALPKPHPVKKEPPPLQKELPPPAVLAPQVGHAEEDRLKQGARARIEGAEQIVKQIDQKRLGKEQQDTYLTIQSFLSKAKEALSINDLLRAFNLADKAQVLANEMVRTLR